MAFKKGGNLDGFIASHNMEFAKSLGWADNNAQNNDEIQIGNELDLTITAVGSRGDGIAKHKGYTVIVYNAKINDKVKVTVERITGKIIFARLK